MSLEIVSIETARNASTTLWLGGDPHARRTYVPGAPPRSERRAGADRSSPRRGSRGSTRSHDERISKPCTDVEPYTRVIEGISCAAIGRVEPRCTAARLGRDTTRIGERVYRAGRSAPIVWQARASAWTAWEARAMAATIEMLFVLFQSVAAVIVVLGIPLLHSRLRVHDAHGYQSPSMLRDAAAWRAISAATGRDLIAIGVTLALFALMLWLTSVSPASFALACSGWILLGATGILLHGIALTAQHRH